MNSVSDKVKIAAVEEVAGEFDCLADFKDNMEARIQGELLGYGIHDKDTQAVVVAAAKELSESRRAANLISSSEVKRLTMLHRVNYGRK